MKKQFDIEQNLEKLTMPIMTPIDIFVADIDRARRDFGETTAMGNGRALEWVGFYESKVRIYDLLCESIPQAKDIPEFWRTAQFFSGLKLREWLQGAIKSVEQCNKCKICSAPISWPKRFCPSCARERQANAKEQIRERARVKQALRRCSCGARLEPRRRFCDACAESRRRETFRKTKGNS